MKRHLLEAAVPKGPAKVAWDGMGEDGQRVPDGSYTVHFELDAGEAGGWWGVVALDGPPTP